MTENTDSRLRTDFLLQQYGKLREEIYHRTYIQQQLVTIAVLGAGAVLTVGTQTSARFGIPALLTYPLLVMFLAVAWATQYAAIRTMGAFISRMERDVFLGDEARTYGWETLLQRPAPRRYAVTALFSGWLDAKGIFVGLQSLALVVVIGRSGVSVEAVMGFLGNAHILRPYLWSMVLGLLDVVAVAITLSLPDSHPMMRRYLAGQAASTEAPHAPEEYLLLEERRVSGPGLRRD